MSSPLTLAWPAPFVMLSGRRAGRHVRRHREHDLGVRPARSSHGSGAQLERAGRRAEAESGYGHDPCVRRGALADVRAVDGEQLRSSRAEVANGRVGNRGVGRERRRRDLRRRLVGHRVEARPALEVRRDGSEPGVVVRIKCPGLAGIVADEAVHVRARTRRHRTVVGVGRRLERLVETVEVGVHRVDQPAGPVVQADRDEGQALRLAVVDAALVEGQPEVVQRQTPEVRRDRHVGEQVEVRRGRLTGADRHELVRAERPLVALERTAAAGVERLVGHVDRVQRAGAGRDDAGLLRRWLRRRQSASRPAVQPGRSPRPGSPAGSSPAAGRCHRRRR